MIDKRNVAWSYRPLDAYADANGLECASSECVLARRLQKEKRPRNQIVH